MPRRRRYATLLLLPLRAAAETPYAKTPYQQWEEDTYYPHSRGGAALEWWSGHRL